MPPEAWIGLPPCSLKSVLPSNPPAGVQGSSEPQQPRGSRGAGVPVSRCPGVLVSRCPGVPVSWCPAVLVSWCPGVPLSRCPGAPLCRCAGVPVSQCCGVPVSRCPGVLLSQCPGVPVSRYPGVPGGSAAIPAAAGRWQCPPAQGQRRRQDRKRVWGKVVL